MKLRRIALGLWFLCLALPAVRYNEIPRNDLSLLTVDGMVKRDVYWGLDMVTGGLGALVIKQKGAIGWLSNVFIAVALHSGRRGRTILQLVAAVAAVVIAVAGVHYAKTDTMPINTANAGYIIADRMLIGFYVWTLVPAVLVVDSIRTIVARMTPRS